MIKKLKAFRFLEFIVDIDFRKWYTKRMRVFAHLFMWVFFAMLLVFNYYFGYSFTLISAILLALRMTLCNVVVFYLFFYVIVPYTFNKNFLFLFILSIPALIVVWLILNFYFYVVIYESNIKIDHGVLDELIKKNNENSLANVLSLKNILGHLFEIVMAIAPFFFIKLFFDLTRLYSKSVKFTRKIELLHVEKYKMENKFLLTQLNPHFLFNTLNNIYALTMKKDDLAPDIILKLSEIMRYTLYEADQDYISLSKEIEFMDNYFEMERMRYSASYKIEKNFSVKKSTKLRIAPLIFFVFVENAFKYGLKSENPFLKIIIQNSDNNLYFAVENDISQKREINDTIIGGIGIENAKRRLELIYPGRHTLKIRNEGSRFSVTLNIILEHE